MPHHHHLPLPCHCLLMVPVSATSLLLPLPLSRDVGEWHLPCHPLPMTTAHSTSPDKRACHWTPHHEDWGREEGRKGGRRGKEREKRNCRWGGGHLCPFLCCSNVLEASEAVCILIDQSNLVSTPPKLPKSCSWKFRFFRAYGVAFLPRRWCHPRTSPHSTQKSFIVISPECDQPADCEQPLFHTTTCIVIRFKVRWSPWAMAWYPCILAEDPEVRRARNIWQCHHELDPSAFLAA